MTHLDSFRRLIARALADKVLSKKEHRALLTEYDRLEALEPNGNLTRMPRRLYPLLVRLSLYETKPPSRYRH